MGAFKMVFSTHAPPPRLTQDTEDIETTPTPTAGTFVLINRGNSMSTTPQGNHEDSIMLNDIKGNIQ